MTLQPRPRKLFLAFLAALLPLAPARATVVELTFPLNPGPTPTVDPFSPTINVLSVDAAPAILNFSPPASPVFLGRFFSSLINLSSDPIASLDLELGRVIDGAFQPSTGDVIFGSPFPPLGFALPTVQFFLGTTTFSGEPFVSLSDDATAVSLDFASALRASSVDPQDGAVFGVTPGDAALLQFDTTSLPQEPFGFRVTVTAVPEPATLALAWCGLGPVLRRPSRRVE